MEDGPAMDAVADLAGYSHKWWAETKRMINRGYKRFCRARGMALEMEIDFEDHVRMEMAERVGARMDEFRQRRKPRRIWGKGWRKQLPHAKGAKAATV